MELTQFRFQVASNQFGVDRLAGFVQGLGEVIVNASGGVAMRFFSDTTGGAGKLREFPSLPEVARVSEPAHESPGVAAALDLVERVFALNVKQLAEICGISTRKPVYDWRKGAVPRPATLARINALQRAARNWERSGFGQPGAALHTPIIHERSLLDLLRAEPLDFEAIQFAGGRVALMRELSMRRKLADPFR